VIAGTIRDERGKPVSEAVVTARLWTSNAGQRVLGDAKGVLTDNAGRFRLHGLSGGTYIVTAQQSSLWSDEGVRRLDEPGDGLSRVDLYASIPRVVTPDSNGGVSVRTGQQRDGIDLVVERRVRRMTTVEGTFVLPSFGPLTQPPRIVQYDDPLEIEQADYAHRGAAMDEAGRFVFRNVRPGKHRVYAQYGSMWAITDIETDGRAISSLVLAPKAGSGVTGRVVVDSISPPSDLRQFEMHLETQLPLNFGAFESFGFSMGENGRFGFKGVPPGRYAIDYYRKSGADPWRVVSVVVNGVEALDFPFEVIEDKDVSDVVVTVSDRHTRLAGVARNANGEPTSETVVVAFPPDSRYWLPDARRVMLALPDSKGRFAFADLPAGDYLIAAIANPPTDGDWDSQLLARLKPIGVSVNLAAGESKMVDVRVR
jgi:protocatechuate 3,4-dioxygenase beta subunit